MDIREHRIGVVALTITKSIETFHRVLGIEFGVVGETCHFLDLSGVDVKQSQGLEVLFVGHAHAVLDLVCRPSSADIERVWTDLHAGPKPNRFGLRRACKNDFQSHVGQRQRWGVDGQSDEFFGWDVLISVPRLEIVFLEERKERRVGFVVFGKPQAAGFEFEVLLQVISKRNQDACWAERCVGAKKPDRFDPCIRRLDIEKDLSVFGRLVCRDGFVIQRVVRSGSPLGGLAVEPQDPQRAGREFEPVFPGWVAPRPGVCRDELARGSRIELQGAFDGDRFLGGVADEQFGTGREARIGSFAPAKFRGELVWGRLNAREFEGLGDRSGRAKQGQERGDQQGCYRHGSGSLIGFGSMALGIDRSIRKSDYSHRLVF